MDANQRYDLDHDDQEVEQAKKDAERWKRYRRNNPLWWYYHSLEWLLGKIEVLWTVDVVYGTIRFIACVMIALTVVRYGYYFLHKPHAERTLPTVEALIQLDEEP